VVDAGAAIGRRGFVGGYGRSANYWDDDGSDKAFIGRIKS
jgi:hypothetical protein